MTKAFDPAILRVRGEGPLELKGYRNSLEQQVSIDRLIVLVAKYRSAEAQETLRDLEKMTKQKFDHD
ncbi:MAG: hypothetical protein OQK97_09555 [Deltaproteobacteria bacterium]|jgi:hypothetical protein|nr:hypothetical protein [Deltaproteobacteria bacterium]